MAVAEKRHRDAEVDTGEVTDIWSDYQHGLMYQSTCGLAKNIPQFVNFFEGRQWAPPTRNTKLMPRPVVNIVKMICRNKRSAILSTPVKLVYRADDDRVDVRKFNDFADYIQKEIGQDLIDKRAIDDGVKKGSYFYHYYWDAEAIGKKGVRDGGLRCELIDILDIFFADPTERDEQKQKWILIASREDVSSVQAKCDRDVDPDLIVPDENHDKYGTVEQEGSRLCTVLTRYFRQNGEVFCEKGTRNVMVNKAFPLSPDVESAARELGLGDGGETEKEDAPNNSLPDDAGDRTEPMMTPRNRASLYPVVVGNYEMREKSIYGLGEVEGLIPNQKAINYNIAMSLLNVQETAWGKYLVLPGALGNQVISNEPGQVLTDYSKTGTGIRRMTEQTIPSAPTQLVDLLTSLTRSVTGSTEIMTGETIGANMSGAAIAQLQSTAQQPIEELRDSFWLVKEKQGKVLAQFFKLFYAEKEFTFKGEVPVFGEDGRPVEDAAGMPVKEEKQMQGVFDSSEYAETEFSVEVETTAGTKASAAGDISILDTLFSKGAITLRTYINSYPKDALSNRDELLRGIEEEENSQLAAAKSQMEALGTQIQKYQEQITTYEQEIAAQKETVDRVVSLINENTSLKAFIANLYAEASGKIAESNRQVALGNQKLEETTKDATDFAETIWQLIRSGNRAEAGNAAAQASIAQGESPVSAGNRVKGNG